MKSRNGVTLTRQCAVLLLAAVLGSLVAVGLLVYYLADRPFPHASPSTGTIPTTTIAPGPKKDVRLPRSVMPRHYHIRLLPILEPGNFTAFGHVAVDVECKEETDRIVLHSVSLSIDHKSVQVSQLLRRLFKNKK